VLPAPKVSKACKAFREQPEQTVPKEYKGLREKEDQRELRVYNEFKDRLGQVEHKEFRVLPAQQGQQDLRGYKEFREEQDLKESKAFKGRLGELDRRNSGCCRTYRCAWSDRTTRYPRRHGTYRCSRSDRPYGTSRSARHTRHPGLIRAARSKWTNRRERTDWGSRRHRRYRRYRSDRPERSQWSTRTRCFVCLSGMLYADLRASGPSNSANMRLRLQCHQLRIQHHGDGHSVLSSGRPMCNYLHHQGRHELLRPHQLCWKHDNG
jgi:hypothetical protein